MTTDATSPSGATVTYPLPAVKDPDNPTPPTAVCTPSSGSVFPIGTTTVTCTATDDNDDVISTVSTTFTITVNGAAAQLAALRQAVNALGFDNIPALFAGIAQQQLAAGHPTLACQTLSQFITDVRQQVPASTAATLIADAERIQAVLGGCGSRPPV
ncbi:MAG: HYR domain-containing protein [Streptosporangiaceae bacterium]